MPLLDRRPKVDGADRIAFGAFITLHTARDHGMGGPMAIRLSEVEAWLNLKQVRDPDLRETIADLVRAMDSAWMEDSRKSEAAERRREREKEEANRPKGRGR